MTFRTFLLAVGCVVAAFALMAFAPRPKPASVGATFAVAPDSTVSATLTVTVRGTLKAGDRIRYKVERDGVVVFNQVGDPYSLTATGIPAPAYGQTATYVPCAHVVYAAGTQSAKVCGTGWTYTRPDVPPAEVEGVEIVPASASVPYRGTIQFAATAPVTWRVVGAGSISASGLYTAPAQP